MMKLEDVPYLRCPQTLEKLHFRGQDDGGVLERGLLSPQRGWPEYDVVDGLPVLYDVDSIPGSDRLLRRVYDIIAPVHDVGTDLILPMIQGESVERGRAQYIKRLRLNELSSKTEPSHILEVGIGTGPNLPLIEDALPHSTEAVIWGMDLSQKMLAWGAKRFNRSYYPRLLLGDVHRLPFADHTFDRVLHVGAVNSWGDRRRGLAEMFRVLKPGGWMVVVDEELDPNRTHSYLQRLAFKALTIYDDNPASPRDLLPEEATDVESNAGTRFYYILSCRRPPTPRAKKPKARVNPSRSPRPRE